MKKYLTIGSMCDLVGDENNTKYLIIGYKKKRKDYEAVLFPGGTTGKKAEFKYFNADEVDEIYDLGYKDEVAIKYLNDLFKEDDISLYDETNLVDYVDETNDEDLEDNIGEVKENRYNLLDKIKFDENGVVISDESAQAPVSEETSNSDLSSMLKFDENGVEISDESTQAPVSEETSKSNLSSMLKFDENGVVISDESNQAPISEETSKSDLSSMLKFDENGVVILDESNQAPVSEETSNSDLSSMLKFDENGVVILDNSTTTEVKNNTSNSLNNIKFDENGIVISE